MKKKEIIDASTPRFTEGNIKVGKMLTWSKLAGSGAIKGCSGTCGKYCQGCYNPEKPSKSACYCFGSYNIYPNVINSHIRNTVSMRKDMKGTFKILDDQIKRKKNNLPIRIHAAGEIESAEELNGWINLAKKNPKNKFYVYTKNVEAVDSVMTKLKNNKKGLPNNFTILISIWHESNINEYLKWKNCKNIKAFAYCDNFDYAKAGLDIKVMCPAYKLNEKGKVKLSHELTCDKCKICFNSKAKVIGCLNH